MDVEEDFCGERQSRPACGADAMYLRRPVAWCLRQAADFIWAGRGDISAMNRIANAIPRAMILLLSRLSLRLTPIDYAIDGFLKRFRREEEDRE